MADKFKLLALTCPWRQVHWRNGMNVYECLAMTNASIQHTDSRACKENNCAPFHFMKELNDE